jgi:hypothetical protein
MADIDIELNDAGMRELLKDEGVRADLARRARNIAQSAGEGMESSATSGRNRALAMAWTETPEAMRAEATTRALTRAVDAGRG